MDTPSVKNKCGNGCGKYAGMKCSACKSVRYCGKECQKKDWKSHKNVCITRPRTTHCTGCRLQFGGSNGKPDEICPDCGYVACADCACHNRRGTCYCAKSNFGHPYCDRVPEWYHYSARTGELYRDDNHPDKYDAELHGITQDRWEKEPRECNNCGKIKLCLIPGYRCTNSLCQ
ncbi:hypothetical protein C8R45DRAFT_1023805 [Mycena sanguinolenta]|nr:hypothetical protein C8R45DRAFT_1023805 [Mycena sanguinolenta]